MDLDGADEVERGTLHLSKGGGGNLLREKLVANARATLDVHRGATVRTARLIADLQRN